MLRRDEKCIQNFCGKPELKDSFGDVGIDRNIIL
jgi:hypothetical protein